MVASGVDKQLEQKCNELKGKMEEVSSNIFSMLSQFIKFSCPCQNTTKFCVKTKACMLLVFCLCFTLLFIISWFFTSNVSSLLNIYDGVSWYILCGSEKYQRMTRPSFVNYIKYIEIVWLCVGRPSFTSVCCPWNHNI